MFKGKDNTNNNLRALKIINKEEMRHRLKIKYNNNDIAEQFKLYIEDNYNNYDEDQTVPLSVFDLFLYLYMPDMH